ncbi:MAG: hypothetical protein LBE38_03735 [Deltaproteobacteria bacterium]|jgi:hypothetical protein|nr:hypothetical protein [Deltaproteobacteria bacterium]
MEFSAKRQLTLKGAQGKQSFIEQVSALKSALKRAAEKLRFFAIPPESHKGDPLALSKKDLREATLIFKGILNANSNETKPLSEEMQARITYNLVELSARAGLMDEALAHFASLKNFDSPLVEEVRAMSLLSLVFVQLVKGNIEAAKAFFKLLIDLGESPLHYPYRAEAAYYLIFDILRSGGSLTQAEDIYLGFVDIRPLILQNPGARRSEVPLVMLEPQAATNWMNLDDPAPFPAPGDFPLTLCSDREPITTFGIPEDLPRMGAGDLTTSILGATALILSVFFGEKGELIKARQYMEEISNWGGPKSRELKLKGAVFLVLYLSQEDPEKAKAFYDEFFGEKTDDKELLVYRAKAATNLLAAYCQRPNLALSKEVFEDFKEISLDLEPSMRASVALNYLGVLVKAGELTKAMALYNTSELWEDATIKGKAAIDLIYYMGLNGHVEGATLIYEDLLDWGSSMDSICGRAGAAIISILEAKEDLESAQRLFDRMGEAESLEGRLEWANSSHSLIRMYGQKGDAQGAYKVFRKLGAWGDHLQLDIQRAGGVVNLILIMGKAGLKHRARELYNLLPAWGTSCDLDLLRAKAAVNLMAVLEQNEELKGSQALFDELPVENPPLALEKVKAAVTLIGLYGKVGQPNKAQAVYEGLPKLHGDLEYELVRQKALLNLIIAQAMAENWQEALQTVAQVQTGFLERDVKEDLIKRLDYIVSHSKEFSRAGKFKVLRLFIEKLKKTGHFLS